MTLTRGRLYVVVTVLLAAGFVIWGVYGVVSGSVPLGWLPAIVAACIGLLAFDRVEIDDEHVRNARIYPVGRFSVPVDQVRAIGVGRQFNGVTAPTLVTDDGAHMLTALGTNRRPMPHVERLSAHLEVPVEPDVMSFGLKRRI